MATKEFAGGTQRRYETSWPSAVFQLYNKIDFSKNNAGSGDVVQCLLIPAGTVVTSVVHIVSTAEGGTSTGTIGDGADADGWISSVNNNATAGTASLSDAVGDSGATLTAIAGGSAGNHTVTGIATSDTLEGVIHFAETTDTLDTMDDLTSEFTISAADTINNADGTDTTGGFLLVSYRSPATAALAAAGGKYYGSEDTIDMTLSAHAVDTAVIEMVAMCMEVRH